KQEIAIPKDFALYQNYPNPFNPLTRISFDLPKSAFVTFKVYNTLGEVLMSIQETYPEGQNEIIFDGSNLTSGIYFYQIQTGTFLETKKMVLVK
ncbi:MAG: T9SS type A sorting domain-containing protein, partial [Patescibacteria group bacterium]|nr:T9SS type A sorting domain-containing protein [Patescibacteria group bacterium]